MTINDLYQTLTAIMEKHGHGADTLFCGCEIRKYGVQGVPTKVYFKASYQIPHCATFDTVTPELLVSEFERSLVANSPNTVIPDFLDTIID